MLLAGTSVLSALGFMTLPSLKSNNSLKAFSRGLFSFLLALFSFDVRKKARYIILTYPPVSIFSINGPPHLGLLSRTVLQMYFSFICMFGISFMLVI